MKEENEKLQKINGKTQDISGGGLVRVPDPDTPGNVLYNVTDNATGKVVAENLPMDEALKINNLYNRRNSIERAANNFTRSTNKSSQSEPWNM